MYYNYNRAPYMMDNRGFFVPFILGGLVGGAAVGATRPRPIVANPGPYYRPYPGPYFY